MTTEHVFEWWQVPCNPFAKKIEPQMLAEEGVIRVVNCRVKGEKANSPTQIRYGRDYVVAWLANQFFDNLKTENWGLHQDLYSQASEYYRKSCGISNVADLSLAQKHQIVLKLIEWDNHPF